MSTRVLMGGYLRWTRADVPRQGQGRRAETAQGETENENPARHPAARDSCRGRTVRTSWRPAGLP
jgi:hypothetical protein